MGRNAKPWLNYKSDAPEREYFKQGASYNEILGYLRNSGFSQGISVFILQLATSVPHHEAKQAVLHSNAWSDVREENLNLQKAIDDFLDQEENDEK